VTGGTAAGAGGAAGATAGVTRRAAAKLNLYLRVVDRRRDGYHVLDSLVAFADVGDVVHAAPAERITLAVDGPFADALMRAGPPGDNLVLRAARALQSLTGKTDGARLTLTKNLPIASGIGGGSADAAAALDALIALWGVRPDPAALDALALSLGADVPVCRAGRPCRMQGIGDQLTMLDDVPETALVLVNPGAPLATKAVFGARAGAFSPPLDGVPALRDARALADLVRTGGNDLEAPARTLLPAVGAVLDALRAAPGCLVAAMSGSGATCFGLFDSAAAAAAAEAQLRAQPHWWTVATRLAPGDAAPVKCR
jgi:4-diphosphocytidyl-2-C-methyl-D-erythritol kinase